MGILSLLCKSNYICFFRPIAKKLGVEAAVLFGELATCETVYGQEFFIQRERLMDATMLSEKQLNKAFAVLKEAGLLTVTRKGMPAKNYYRINEDAFLANFFEYK
jgi:DNA-binding transcriptional ArsR family regulator